MSAIDNICRENSKCPFDMVGEFLKNNEEFLDRIIFVHDVIFWSMIEQKFLEEFKEFVVQKK